MMTCVFVSAQRNGSKKGKRRAKACEREPLRGTATPPQRASFALEANDKCHNDHHEMKFLISRQPCDLAWRLTLATVA